jgi:WD40 repeat protein
MLASSSGNKIIKLWNISDGSLIRDLTGHNESVIFDYKYI